MSHYLLRNKNNERVSKYITMKISRLTRETSAGFSQNCAERVNLQTRVPLLTEIQAGISFSRGFKATISPIYCTWSSLL